MGSRTKLFMMILMMILTALLTVYITYAWFTMSEKSRPIIITTGTLAQNAHLYVAIDENYDGVFEGQYTELDQSDFSIPAAIPGQIYTFKIIAINVGTVAGNLSIKMNNIETNTPALLDYFELKYINPLNDTMVTRSLVSIPEVEPEKDIIFFEDVTVPLDEPLFELNFTIRVLDTLPSNLGAVTLTITNYILTLVQLDYE